MKIVVEEVLKCHNTSFEILASKFVKFLTSENKVKLNSYLIGIVVCQNQKAIQ